MKYVNVMDADMIRTVPEYIVRIQISIYPEIIGVS